MFSSLETLERQLKRSSTAIAEELTRLDEQVVVLKGQWTGEAAAAYDVAHAKWTAQMAEMNSLLARISSAVGTARAVYSAAEREFSSKL